MSKNIPSPQKTTHFRLLLSAMLLVLVTLAPPLEASSLRENPQTAQAVANEYLTVQVTIIHVEALDLIDGSGTTERADFFAAVRFFHDDLRIDNEGNPFKQIDVITPGWKLSRNQLAVIADVNVSFPLVIEIWDDDPETGKGASADDLIDLDGDHRGNGPGRSLDLFFVADRLPNGRFTCTITGDVNGRCGDPLVEAGTEKARARLTFKVDIVSIQESRMTDVVVTINDVDGGDDFPDSGNRRTRAADFYAAVSVNDQRSDNRDLEESLMFEQQQVISPNWRFLKNVPSGERSTDVIVEIFDRDPGREDDRIDIDSQNPGGGSGRDLNLILDLFFCRISGNEDGACGGFTQMGAEEKHAEITYHIDAFPNYTVNFNDEVSLGNLPPGDNSRCGIVLNSTPYREDGFTFLVQKSSFYILFPEDPSIFIDMCSHGTVDPRLVPRTLLPHPPGEIQMTYDPTGNMTADLFNLVGIRVLQGRLDVVVQGSSGGAICRDLRAGEYVFSGANNLTRVRLLGIQAHGGLFTVDDIVFEPVLHPSAVVSRPSCEIVEMTPLEELQIDTLFLDLLLDAFPIAEPIDEPTAEPTVEPTAKPTDEAIP